MKLTKKHIGKYVRRVGNCPVTGQLSEVDEHHVFIDGWPHWHDDPETGTWELDSQGLTLQEACEESARLGIPFVMLDDIGKEVPNFLAAYASDLLREANGGSLLPVGLTHLKACYRMKLKEIKISRVDLKKAVSKILPSLPSDKRQTLHEMVFDDLCEEFGL